MLPASVPFPTENTLGRGRNFDRELKRELGAVLREADERLAKNRYLAERSLASLMTRQGTHRFKEPTLRKIIGRRYPPLERLGIVGNIQKD